MESAFDPTIVAGCLAAALLAFAFWRYLLALLVVGFITLTLLGFDRVWMTLRG